MRVFAAETTRAPVLVTGGAGFIGSRLVEALVARGERVRVLDDLSSGSRANLAAVLPEIELLVGDVRDRQLLARALDAAATVFHLAALATVSGSLRDPERTLSVNVDGTRSLLLEAAAAGVGRLVLASSAAVYGESLGLPLHEQLPLQPASPYALSKLAAEQMVLAFAQRGQFAALVLRCFNVYGPRQDAQSPDAGVIARFCRAALDDAPCELFGDGAQRRDFVFVDDVVQANLLAADASLSGVALNVARGDATTLREVLATLEHALGRPVAWRTAPARPAEIRSSLADIRAAQEQLGYRPQVGLREGLARTLAWYAAQPSALP